MAPEMIWKLLLCLPSVTKAQAPSGNTANIKDIAAEEAIASVVEEMELPADMTPDQGRIWAQ